MRLQRRQPEAVVERILSVWQTRLDVRVLPFGIALPNHPEQTIQRIADVGALLVFFAAQLSRVHVPQAFKAVAKPVHLTFHGRIAQVRPALDIEEKQQPVHVPQAFARQLLGIRAALVDAFFLTLQPLDRFIAQQLDGLAQRVLEITAYLVGVLVAVFVQLIQQWRVAATGAGVLTVQQGRGRQQRIGIVLPQQRIQLKAQQP